MWVQGEDVGEVGDRHSTDASSVSYKHNFLVYVCG